MVVHVNGHLFCFWVVINYTLKTRNRGHATWGYAFYYRPADMRLSHVHLPRHSSASYSDEVRQHESEEESGYVHGDRRPIKKR
jgi:hypothetical protein